MVLGKKEKSIILLILFILAITITYVSYTKGNFDSPHRGDSAFLLETTYNMLHNNTSKSSAFGAFVQYHLEKVGFKKAEDFTLQDFQLISGDQAVSTFSNHTYYIIYALAEFGKIFDIEKMFYTVHVFSFFILLYFMYKVLREKSVNILSTALFLILVFIHPAFSLSMSGQFYIERLIIPFAAMLLYYIHNKNSNIYILYVLVIIICTLTERTSMYTGIFMILYIVLFWKDIIFRKRLHMLLMAILSFIYSLWALHSIQKMMGSQVSSFFPHSFNDLIIRMSNVVFLDNLFIYLLFSVLFLGFFTLINWKYFIILVVMLIPNAIGDIGGAEKSGYITHYHSLYFPFIVFLSALGYAQIVNQIKNNYYRMTVFVIMMVLLIISSSLFSPYKKNFEISNAIKENVLFKDIHLYSELLNNDSFTRKYINNYHKINEIIPKKAVVVSSEFIINILWKDRVHYMFPLGIDKADYVVILATKNGDEYNYAGFTSYVLSANEIKKVDDMAIARMKSLGYDFENQVIVNDFAIIKRKK